MYLKRLLMMVLSIILLAGCTASIAQQQSTENRLNELQEELDTLKVRILDIEERLQENPKTARFNVDYGDDPRLGSHDARIAIVEFSDFQCPFCKRFQTKIFPELKKEYIDTGKVVLVYKDFPLPMHANAKSAAVAANCARQQNKYWPYQEALFNDQSAFGHDHYMDLAKQHNLDMLKFSTCLDDKKQIEEIEKDVTYGSSLGVEGTPSFFIGKVDQSGHIVDAKLVVGAQPLSVFRQVIDKWLSQID